MLIHHEAEKMNQYSFVIVIIIIYFILFFILFFHTPGSKDPRG